jgi:hypothetical protein
MTSSGCCGKHASQARTLFVEPLLGLFQRSAHRLALLLRRHLLELCEMTGQPRGQGREPESIAVVATRAEAARRSTQEVTADRHRAGRTVAATKAKRESDKGARRKPPSR